MRKLLFCIMLLVLASNGFSQGGTLDSLLIPDAEDRYLMKLSDLRFLRCLAVTPISTEGDSIADAVLLVFDNVTTDRPYDLFTLIELPGKDYKQSLSRDILYIAFIYKIDEINNKIFYITYFPHATPYKRFIGGVVYLNKFEDYFRTSLYYVK